MAFNSEVRGKWRAHLFGSRPVGYFLPMPTVHVREPRARDVEFGADTLIVRLEDGRSISAPLAWFPRLRDASESDRRQWRLIGRGVGVHWETVDEDLSVRGLLEGATAAHARHAS